MWLTISHKKTFTVKFFLAMVCHLKLSRALVNTVMCLFSWLIDLNRRLHRSDSLP